MTDFVSDDVRAFLREYIESYEELEVLLLLQRESPHPSTGPSLGARLHIDPSVVEAVLIALGNRKLVESAVDRGAKCYQLPAVVAGNQTLGRLATLYTSNPIEIIKLMSAHSIERIRTAALRAFADAFVFRKDKKNG